MIIDSKYYCWMDEKLLEEKAKQKRDQRRHKNWKKLHRSNRLPRSIGHDNLIKIDCCLNHVLHRLNNDMFLVSLAYAQLIRKHSILYGYLHFIKCYISVVTETWLRDYKADDAWIQSLDLCINEYNWDYSAATLSLHTKMETVWISFLLNPLVIS